MERGSNGIAAIGFSHPLPPISRHCTLHAVPARRRLNGCRHTLHSQLPPSQPSAAHFSDLQGLRDRR
ncbi:hypothetical protein SDJN03_08235, partial [Cucurbita argyrosperma subsp. sororia]